MPRREIFVVIFASKVQVAEKRSVVHLWGLFFSMTKNVFLSVGGTANQEQEIFVQAVENRLRAEGLNPNTVGRNTFSVDAPLKTVEELMDRCSGTVVLALERTYFPNGLEKRGGSREQPISEILLPTPWNHIEAALAYSRGLPLLVIVQEGLKHEGLLEPGYDWYVQTTPIDGAYLNSVQFNGVLASWKAKVFDRSVKQPASETKKLPDPSSMSIGQIVGAMKPSHLWSVLTALAAALTGAFLLGAQLSSASSTTNPASVDGGPAAADIEGDCNVVGQTNSINCNNN